MGRRHPLAGRWAVGRGGGVRSPSHLLLPPTRRPGSKSVGLPEPGHYSPSPDG